jgi:hypothetical protein
VGHAGRNPRSKQSVRFVPHSTRPCPMP